jgi:hypothetical protein
MELRFAQHARATKDLDIGMGGPRSDRLRALTDALQLGFDEFTFRVKAQTRDMERADTIRIEVAVQYRTRAWQTVELDLGPGLTDHVDLVAPRVQGFAELGIPLVSPVRCLNLADQVAQKLHACTGPGSIGRARDILDILLIDALGELNYREAGDAARRVFAERATHAFPPELTIPEEWNVELESLASDLGFHLKTREEIEGRFREVIALLARDRANV